MPNRKVLITEDNPGDFELFRNALKEAGYNIDLVQHKITIRISSIYPIVN